MGAVSHLSMYSNAHLLFTCLNCREQKLVRDIVEQTLDIKLENPVIFPAPLTRDPYGIECRFSRPVTRTFVTTTGRSAPSSCIGTLASRWCAACASPLASERWFLQFRAKACIRLAPYTPSTVRPVIRLRTDLSREIHTPSVLVVLKSSNDTSSKGLFALSFRMPTCPGSCPRLLSQR